MPIVAHYLYANLLTICFNKIGIQCSNYIAPAPTPTPTLTPVPTPTPFEGTPSVSPYVWNGSWNTTKLGESGIVIKVVDGDTFDVEGIGRTRLADINTPEMDSKEGREAKEYVKGLCYQRKVYLDIDDLYVRGKYGRIIAVVYVPYNETHYVNLNQLLLKEGYAEARDYPNEFDPDDWMGPREYVAIEPSPVRSPLPISGFEFLFAMIGGVVAAICLIRRRGIR
jgi:endonuclease YncB( thermonuclease family)